MKIVHLSDLHVCARNKQLNIGKARFLIEKAMEIGADHIIITGDLVDNPEPRAFRILRNMFEEYGLLSPDKMSVTIGNHEIFGGVHLAEDIIHFPSKCRNTDYAKRVRDFRFHFRELFRQNETIDLNDTFPYLKRLNDLAIIGLNSIAPYHGWRNPFASNGRISDADFRKLELLLAKAKKFSRNILVLMHHHNSRKMITPRENPENIWEKIEKTTLKFHGFRRLAKLLRAYDVRMVLHGHVHESAGYHRGGIEFLNAAGSANSTVRREFALNVLEVTGEKITTEILRIPVRKNIYRHIRLSNEPQFQTREIFA
jgi:3',5'-cyclic AMP phosphodiesterase CpdA